MLEQTVDANAQGVNTIPSARIAQVTSEIKARHTPAIAREIDALFERLPCEQPPVKIKLNNALPADLPGGAYVRIGPNPRPGSHCPGFLDGDGMLLAVVFGPPEEREEHAYFSTAWVRTAGFEKEEAAGGDLFQGTLGAAPRGWPVLGAVMNNIIRAGMAVKDTCNTAVSFHAGRLLARMEQCRPSELRVSRTGAITTIKALSDLEGAVPGDPVTGGALGAHFRVDPSTGEKICVSYSTGGPGQGPPLARHDVWGKDGRLSHSAAVPLPAPIMVHDLAITKSHSVIFDLPLTVRIEKTLLDRFLVEYEERTPARLGLLPRYGSPEQVQWFEVEAGVVLHAINAHDRADGAVVVQALRAVPSSPSAYIMSFTPAFPYQWVLDPRTGACLEEGYLLDTPCEQPAVSPHMHGAPARFAYAHALSSAGGPVTQYACPREMPRIDRVIKIDLERRVIAGEYAMPPKRILVSEPTFVPKVGAPDPAEGGREDAGYILALASEVEEGTCRGSTLLVLDAQDLNGGPVAEVALPACIPFGLHSEFVPYEALA